MTSFKVLIAIVTFVTTTACSGDPGNTGGVTPPVDTTAEAGSAGGTSVGSTCQAMCTAEPGPVGPAGPQGSVGPTGPTGAQGPAGSPGAPGAKGDMGPAGMSGPSGPVGPAGADGQMGPMGPMGLTGAQGPVGTQGPAGSVGPAGAAGAVGPAGPQGPAAPALSKFDVYNVIETWNLGVQLPPKYSVQARCRDENDVLLTGGCAMYNNSQPISSFGPYGYMSTLTGTAGWSCGVVTPSGTLTATAYCLAIP